MKKTAFVFTIFTVSAIILACLINGCQSTSETKAPPYHPSHPIYQTEPQKADARIAELETQHEALNQKIYNMQRQQMQTGAAFPAEMNVPIRHSYEYTVADTLIASGSGHQPDRLACDFAHVSEDEVWVIVRPPASDYYGDDQPRSGSMLACFPHEDIRKPLPLKHTDVKAHVAGYIATVDVTQQFHNPYYEKIEAVYVFPLPQDAAVNEFIMTVGSRTIRGIIRERQQAEQIYEQAKSQGYTASLLTQERPNIFTQKVANIEPGKAIDISIKYCNTLTYVDGWYEFVFPMVVGPRFNPPYMQDGVGAVAVSIRGSSGQKTEIQYLKPHERSGHDISLSLDINAGVRIEKIECPSHSVLKTKHYPEVAAVTLNACDSIPNKDFVLRYKVAGKMMKQSFITHSGKHGDFFTLMLYPPEDVHALPRVPVEMIFVLDCSGSMSGEPIKKAKGAIKRTIKKLRPDDTFQVIRFSSNASQLGAYPVPATPRNIRRGIKYVNSLKSGGGTMMIEGIKAALNFPHDPHRLRLVSFMTDGYIGNEAEILAAVHDHLGSSRIFSFGIGNSVNRYLLDRMAKVGRGAVAYVGLHDNSAEIVDRFYDRISHPALMDVSIDWGGLQVSDVYPSSIPDVFTGRPIILTGRYHGHLPTSIRVTGKVGDVYRQITIPVLTDEMYLGHEGIGFVWARKKIEELNSRMIVEGYLSGRQHKITDVALRHGIMSPYTAFVAVDSLTKTQSDYGVTVAVPVPVPDGVRYDTTVEEN